MAMGSFGRLRSAYSRFYSRFLIIRETRMLRRNVIVMESSTSCRGRQLLVLVAARLRRCS